MSLPDRVPEEQVPRNPLGSAIDDEIAFTLRYDIGNRIGQGLHSLVYKATRCEDNKAVAVKVIKQQHIEQWEVENGIQIPQEISILRKLSSTPGVVKFFESFYFKNEYRIVMETFDNCISLFEYILSRKFLKEAEAKHYFKQIVQATMNCFYAGIVHNDLKSVNILVDLDTSTAKLIGFGKATYLDTSRFQKACGTLLFYPPEYVISGEGQSEAAAVWTLGCVLYDMIFADIPFACNSDIRRKKVVMKKEVTSMCQEFLERCFEKDAMLRPSFMNLLAHAWLTND